MLRKIVPDVIKDQSLVNLTADATVREAAALMKARNVGSVAILDDACLKGIFTERDMVSRVVAEHRDPDTTTLGEVMTVQPDSIAPSATALDALRLMEDGGYRHLPVVEGNKVIGMVSRRDFIGAEKAQLEEETALWERMG